MSGSLPLVSCICLTHHRVAMLARAIRCFQSQSYQSRELIVALTSDNEETLRYIHELKDPSIKIVSYPNASMSLGQKRNYAVGKSGGKYFCVWDDDDWHAPDRLDFQVRSLKDSPFKSAVLSNVILFDSVSGDAYLSATRWAWEQTLLCERAVMNESTLRYRDSDRGEDSTFVYHLKENNLLLTLSDATVYIYVYHGGNTWNRNHWNENLLPWATKLSRQQSDRVARLLDTSGGSVQSLPLDFLTTI